MPNYYVFADEAGCFTFNRNNNVSRYFILCTITAPNLNTAIGLKELRHSLIWEGVKLNDYFHATTESQDVRDRVFAEICKHDFSIQATICEKAKAQPQITKSKARFYKIPWFYHFKNGIGPYLKPDYKLLVTAASIGTKKEKETFTNSLNDVMQQTLPIGAWAVDFRPCQADPCLQVADYCAWAIQRKWERNDTRSYDLIKGRITREYDLWRHGRATYY